MVSYMLWLLFQLKTHRSMFDEPSRTSEVIHRSGAKNPGEALKSLATAGAVTSAVSGGMINQQKLIFDPPEGTEGPDGPQLTLSTAVAVLIIFTAVLAFNAQYATDSLQGLMASHGVSPTFMGVVVLPILSNDPTSIDSAMRDNMDASIALTLERCMQTALMVVPLIVLIAWGLGIDDMTLDFDGFTVAALFASIIIVTYVVQEGKSNWLTGALLIKVFIIVGLASYYAD